MDGSPGGISKCAEKLMKIGHLTTLTPGTYYYNNNNTNPSCEVELISCIGGDTVQYCYTLATVGKGSTLLKGWCPFGYDSNKIVGKCKPY